MSSPSTTIIMAGGLGKRMNSILPKVLHKIGEYPMIYYVVNRAIEIGSSNILIVVGKYKDMIKSTLDNLLSENDCKKIHYIFQPEIKDANGEDKVGGTGHAILCCLPFFLENNIDRMSKVYILSGDVPLLKKETLIELGKTENSLLITNSDSPTGCGRVFFDLNYNILKIIEENDCSPEERENTYVNCGIYNVVVETLLQCIPEITNNNAAGEYYLTDIIEITINKLLRFSFYELPKENGYEVMNINNQKELMKANEIFQIFTS